MHSPELNIEKQPATTTTDGNTTNTTTTDHCTHPHHDARPTTANPPTDNYCSNISQQLTTTTDDNDTHITNAALHQQPTTTTTTTGCSVMHTTRRLLPRPLEHRTATYPQDGGAGARSGALALTGVTSDLGVRRRNSTSPLHGVVHAPPTRRARNNYPAAPQAALLHDSATTTDPMADPTIDSESETEQSHQNNMGRLRVWKVDDEDSSAMDMRPC